MRILGLAIHYSSMSRIGQASELLLTRPHLKRNPDIAALETKVRGRPFHTPPTVTFISHLQGSELALDKLNRFQKPPGFCRKVALALIRVRNTGKLLQHASVGESGLSDQLSGVSRFTAPGLRLREVQVGKREFEIRLKR
jgi:hypothetical protein